MYIRVHSWATSLQANSLLLNFTDIPVRSEKPFTISFFENSLSGSVHPCTLPDASFCCAKTSLLISPTDIPAQECTSCTFLGYEFAGQTRFCMEPPTSLSVLKSLLPLAFLKIGGADARSVQKTPAGVLFVRRGLFFVKRQRRCPPIFKKKVLKILHIYSIIRNCTEI